MFYVKNVNIFFHCFDRDTAIKIQNDDVENMYLSPQNCRNFYPERKQ